MGWQLEYWDLFCPAQALVNRGLRAGAEKSTGDPKQQKKAASELKG